MGSTKRRTAKDRNYRKDVPGCQRQSQYGKKGRKETVIQGKGGTEVAGCTDVGRKVGAKRQCGRACIVERPLKGMDRRKGIKEVKGCKAIIHKPPSYVRQQKGKPGWRGGENGVFWRE